MMTGLFSAWRSWRQRRLILRDVRRHSADAREVDHFKIKDQLTFADSALDNNDSRRATEIWNKLIASYPWDALLSSLALRVLTRLRRYDEATEIMRNAQRRYPGEPKFPQGLGRIAQAKGDHDEAIMIYGRLRKRFPGVMEGYTKAAESLRIMNRPDEAEQLITEAMKRFHSEIAPFLEHARIAVLREDWEEALRRWQPVRDRFGHVIGLVGAAQALSHLGRYEEAEELLQGARYQYGADPGPLSEYARVAEAKGNIAEAVQRWKDVRYHFPLDMHVQSAASEAFEKLGEPAEAELTLRAAMDRFPSEFRPMLDLAKLLQIKHRNFPEAAEVWAAIRLIFPDNEEAYTSGAEALRQAGRTGDADALCEDRRLRFMSR
jgi:tetratricopeptide (TPR) repeat protein